MPQNNYGILPENSLEEKIVESDVFKIAADFGNIRKGHPEGKIGIHIKEILDFIDKQNWQNYRKDLRLLALLHDLGKYRVVGSENGHVVGKGHSTYSVDIAKEFISDDRILNLILIHDKYYHFYTKNQIDKRKFNELKFLNIYKFQDLDTLIRFNYADSCNRGKDSIKWFEDVLYNLGLRKNKIYEYDLTN